jgi:formamidopyrimidine-DNA glycosylase
MPEGPEVKRMGLSLESRILDETVTRAEVLGGKWIKTPPTGINEFQESLPARVTAVTVKGKTIHIHFDNGWRIWNTLGMSGGWKDSRTKHAHFVFTTQGGRDVWFDDVRRFGNLIFIQHESDFNKRLKAVGPDLLAAETEFKDFERAISKRSTPICKALMDQKVIAGVGNYIKAEALYRARISPHSLCRDIPTSKLEELYNQLRWIMSKSLQQGGATFSTYSDMDGGEGSFPFYFHVYMKSTCPLGYPVVRELTEDGRTTHWVPQVQIN